MSVKLDIEQVDGIGALESLTTANKSNLVNAINEVKGSIPTNYITTNTNQTGLSGDKTTSGQWTISGILIGTKGGSGLYLGFSSSKPFSFFNGSNAQQIFSGGLLTSDVYTDSVNIPTNGIWSRGNISSLTGFIKHGYDNTQILLAGGGHRPVSDFALANGSNLTNLVPYTGATSNVNLNSKSITNVKGIQTETLYSGGYATHLKFAQFHNEVQATNFTIQINSNTTSSFMGAFSVIIYGYSHKSMEFRVNMYKFQYNYFVPIVNWISGDSANITNIRFIKKSDSELAIEINLTSGNLGYSKVVITDVVTNIGGEMLNPDNFVILRNADNSEYTLHQQLIPSQFIRDSYLWNKGNFTQTNINNWNTAYGWGNHTGLYSLVNHTHNNYYPKTTNNLNGADANTLTTDGIYHGYNWVNGAMTDIGTIQVLHYSPDWISQIHYIPNPYGVKMYKRARYSGTTWSPWVEIKSTDTTYVAGTGLTLTGTTFSVNYGTVAGTVAQGNDSRIVNGQTAYGWGNFRDYGLGIKADHNYDANAERLRDNGFYTLGLGAVNRPSYISSSYASGILTISENTGRRVQIATGGNAYDRLSFRSLTDTTQINWLEFYHTGNFNPAQYVLQTSLSTQLANYVPINGVTTINNTKTFTSSPIVPNATLDGHAVNLGQLNSAVSSVKTRIGINGSNYTDAGDINLIANSGVILNKVGNNIYIESTGTPHSSKMTNEVNFPDFTTIELNTDKHYIYCDNSYNFSEITIDVGQAKDGYELIIFCGEDPNVGQNPYIIMNADVIRPNGQEYDTILLSRGKWYRFIYFKDLDKLMLSGYGEV